MVKIRLTRLGDIHTPIYRVIVTDSRKPRDSDYLDLLGLYNPKGNTGETKIDAEKAKTWLAKGAIPTDTVKAILIKAGAMPEPAVRAPAKTPKKKEAKK
ncbi:MAG: 30S ribosomal protein S16 [Clostridiales bacterium]|jgi:small subunit ribosomal protein S16|nr:30S ribosomal protein S16 [Clostridiales bacterium]